MDSAKRVAAGTHGKLWIDGVHVGEVYGLTADVDIKRTPVPMTGELWEDEKMMGLKGSGVIKRYKANSRMAEILGDYISKGIDPRFRIISLLDDPDAYGAERVVIKGVGFNKLSLAGWEAGSISKEETPFVFRGYEYIDRIEDPS